MLAVASVVRAWVAQVWECLLVVWAVVWAAACAVAWAAWEVEDASKNQPHL